jgi:hypothetical protein
MTSPPARSRVAAPMSARSAFGRPLPLRRRVGPAIPVARGGRGPEPDQQEEARTVADHKRPPLPAAPADPSTRKEARPPPDRTATQHPRTIRAPWHSEVRAGIRTRRRCRGLHPPAILATWIARGPAVQQGSDAARSSAMERRARWLNRSTPKAAPQPAGRALTSVMRAAVCSSTLDYTREKRWLCPRGRRAARPSGALRAIDCPACPRSCGPAVRAAFEGSLRLPWLLPRVVRLNAVLLTEGLRRCSPSAGLQMPPSSRSLTTGP